MGLRESLGGGSFAQYIQEYFPAVSPSLVCRKRRAGRQAHQEHEVAAAAAALGVDGALCVSDDDNGSSVVHHANSALVQKGRKNSSHGRHGAQLSFEVGRGGGGCQLC